MRKPIILSSGISSAGYRIMRVGLLGGLALLPVSVAVAAEPGVNALDYPGPAWSPSMWVARFGDSLALRAAIGFGGGLLMAYGARLAAGAPAGTASAEPCNLTPATGSP